MTAFFYMKSFSIFDSTQILLLNKIYYILILFLVVFFGCTKNKIAKQNTNSHEDSLSTYLTLANDDHLPYDLQKKIQSKSICNYNESKR